MTTHERPANQTPASPAGGNTPPSQVANALEEQIDEHETSSIWRFTDAEWSVLPWTILAALPIAVLTGLGAGQAGYAIGCELASGAPCAIQPFWKAIGLSWPIAAFLYTGLCVLTAVSLVGVIKRWLSRLDEAERHIEYRAYTHTLFAMTLIAFFIAPLGYWFDIARPVIDGLWPIFLLCGLLAYYPIRAYLRKSMNA